MSLESWISVAMAVPSILAGVGSLTVLFYRVNRLESEHRQMQKAIDNNQQELHEMKELLARMDTTLTWIKDALKK